MVIRSDHRFSFVIRPVKHRQIREQTGFKKMNIYRQKATAVIRCGSLLSVYCMAGVFSGECGLLYVVDEFAETFCIGVEFEQAGKVGFGGLFVA